MSRLMGSSSTISIVALVLSKPGHSVVYRRSDWLRGRLLVAIVRYFLILILVQEKSSVLFQRNDLDMVIIVQMLENNQSWLRLPGPANSREFDELSVYQ